MPPRVRTLVGASAVQDYHREEAEKVLRPIEKFLQRHAIAYTTRWTIGNPGAEIVKAAKKDKAQMIVMGTHGHGILGRAILGSVTQNVLTQAEIPVLLVK
jgi:nucleotide-binding universal stress UspA family protein